MRIEVVGRFDKGAPEQPLLGCGDLVIWEHEHPLSFALVLDPEESHGIGVTHSSKVFWSRKVALEVLQSPEEWV